MNIIFKGHRHPKRNVVTVNDKPLPECLDILNKSPNGFEWGYGGSGPSQLALAISVHLVGTGMALEFYQDVKRRFISGIKEDTWTLDGEDILHFIVETSEASGRSWCYRCEIDIAPGKIYCASCEKNTNLI